ncbi:MAG: hypothetical protein A4S12_13070 [Proteobacteria bacterium SG_bin5]|nr:stage II sporulation protein M [Sphingomonas sp.]OQW45105.1 MAG: hypothetical protein A4S12_13070 [Proteobacteria bacterium SG_bin5]
MSAPPPVLVNATRFRAAHQGDWERLERLVARLEKGAVGSLDPDDLLALPQLYRATLSSLSVARETSLDRALIAYLEQLSRRAYFQLYGVPTSPGAQLRDFFARGWPGAVKALWRETLVSALLFAVSAVLGYVLIRQDPSLFGAIIDPDLAGGRVPGASAAVLRETLYDPPGRGGAEGALATFATFLFTHNAQVSILCFALGFAFGVPTVMLLITNGLMMGALFAVFVPAGLGPNLAAWLSIHGTTEIFAIFLSAAAGLRIGTAIAFPGRQGRIEAAVAQGRLAATAMGGTVVMLAVAGVLEGIGRQTVQGDAARALIGLAMLTLWLAYFYLPRGGRRGAA